MNSCSHIRTAVPLTSTAEEPFRILSIDGGGIRGITPAMLIAEIEHRTNKKAHELFDIIAGVSIGSLIGAGLTHNKSADEIVRLWESEAKITFSRSPVRVITTANGIISPKWPLDNLDHLLIKNFGEALLTDCTTELICPAYETTTGDPRYFSRNAARNDPAFSAIKMSDVVKSSSAAPGYFRSNSMTIQNQELNFIDGAVFAPNPSEIAYSCAGAPEHSLLLSLGTGRFVKPLTYKETAQMGFLGWVTEGNLIDLMTQANAQNIHTSMERILKDNYFRWQTQLDRHPSLDDAAEIPYLMRVSNEFIGQNDKEIDRICDIFAAASNR